MNYFKVKNNIFKIFIRNSMINLENQKYSVYELSNTKELTLKPPHIKRLVRNLDILTQEDRIIWNRDFEGLFRGIIIKGSKLSNFKIFVENNFCPEFEEYDEEKFTEIDPICRICLVKDNQESKKVEYIINLNIDNYEIISLFDTIERKLMRENN